MKLLLHPLIACLLAGRLLAAAAAVSTPVVPRMDSMQDFGGGTGCSSLRLMEQSPDGTEAVLAMEYEYNGMAGFTAQVFPVLEKKGQKGVNAWFGVDPVMVPKGRGAISMKVKYFNDEPGVPPQLTTDRVRMLFVNEGGTAIVGSSIFPKTIKWGAAGPEVQPPTEKPSQDSGKASGPPPGKTKQAKSREELRQEREAQARLQAERQSAEKAARLAEEKAREEKRLQTLADAKQKAFEKRQAEDQARLAAKAETARLQAEKKAQELQQAEEKAQAQRLAEEKRKANEQALQLAKEQEKARIEADRQARVAEQTRLQAEQKVRELKLAEEKAKSQRLAEEKRQADEQARRLAQEQEKARIEADRQARLAEQKAQELKLAQEKAQAQRLAEEKRQADEQARLLAKEKEQAKAEADRQARLAEEKRIQAEQKAQELKLAQEKAQAQRLAEEKRQADEQARRLAREREKAKAETERQARLAEQKAQELKLAQEKAQAQLLAEEKRQAAEQARRLAAEQEKAKAEADRQARLAEENRIQAEQKALELKLAGEKAQAQRLAEEKRQAEELRTAQIKEPIKTPATTPGSSPAPTTPAAKPPVVMASLKTKITGVDVVNRSLDRTRMTIGVEFDYNDNFGKPMLGVDLQRSDESDISKLFQTNPSEIGRRRNFVLLPVQYKPPTDPSGRYSSFTTDQLLVYLAESAASSRFNIYNATMFLVWRAPGLIQAAAQAGAGVFLEFEEIKQTSVSSGQISVRYGLPSTGGKIRFKLFDSAKPATADFFDVAPVEAESGRHVQLLDFTVKTGRNIPGTFRADTIVVELVDAQGKIAATNTRKIPMTWTKP